MKALALHGFLGQGTDWNPVMDSMDPNIDWIMPSLFSPSSEIPLSSFDDFTRHITAMKIEGPKILVGYSMGGRLAYELFLQNPDEWEALLVVSAHPGLSDSKEANDRRKQVQVWLERFRNWDWSDLLAAWNSQPVLKNSRPLKLKEERFHREKLCQALENLSVDRQVFNGKLLKQNTSKIWAYVGSEDSKYLEIYSGLQNTGVIENISVINGLGHRILQDGPELLGPQLEAALEL